MEKLNINNKKTAILMVALTLMLAFMLFITTSGSAFAAGYTTQTRYRYAYTNGNTITFRFTLTYNSYTERIGNSNIKMVSGYKNPVRTVTLPGNCKWYSARLDTIKRIDGGRTYTMSQSCTYLNKYKRYETRSAYAEFYYVQ